MRHEQKLKLNRNRSRPLSAGCEKFLLHPVLTKQQSSAQKAEKRRCLGSTKSPHDTRAFTVKEVVAVSGFLSGGPVVDRVCGGPVLSAGRTFLRETEGTSWEETKHARNQKTRLTFFQTNGKVLLRAPGSLVVACFTMSCSATSFRDTIPRHHSATSFRDIACIL